MALASKCLVCGGLSKKQAVMLGCSIPIQIRHYNYLFSCFFFVTNCNVFELDL